MARRAGEGTTAIREDREAEVITPMRAGLLALAVALGAAAVPRGLPAHRADDSDTAAAAQAGATVEIKASRHGFEPSSLTLRRGETAHFVLTSSDDEHCFAIDALRVEKRILPGRPTRFDLALDRTGVFAFYCCRETGDAARRERGQLTVGD